MDYSRVDVPSLVNYFLASQQAQRESQPMEEQGQAAPAQWKGDLSTREQIQIAHAVNYTSTYSDAGIPGHNHIVLIAKLAKKLDDLEYSITHPLTGPE